MLLLVWVSLGVGVLAAAGGAALAVVRGLRGWRRFRSASAKVTGALEGLAASAAATAERVGGAVERTAALAEANARLERALAELRVLRRASDRARSGIDLLRAAIPRK